jgi:hypothetical protein
MAILRTVLTNERIFRELACPAYEGVLKHRRLPGFNKCAMRCRSLLHAAALRANPAIAIGHLVITAKHVVPCVASVLAGLTKSFPVHQPARSAVIPRLFNIGPTGPRQCADLFSWQGGLQALAMAANTGTAVAIARTRNILKECVVAPMTKFVAGLTAPKLADQIAGAAMIPRLFNVLLTVLCVGAKAVMRHRIFDCRRIEVAWNSLSSDHFVNDL